MNFLSFTRRLRPVVNERLLGSTQRPKLMMSPSSTSRGITTKLPDYRSISTSLCNSHVGERSRLLDQRKRYEYCLTSQRCFNSEQDYHIAADETLEDIQDTVEEALEDANINDFDVNLASGVLTISMPPHGTWVINKQTPNKQLWWSSPISGPRRYEYEDGDWVYTRDDSHSSTLLDALTEEVQQIYQIELDF